jgi:hypothetical protein
MTFRVSGYSPAHDRALLELFYRSVFFERKEFEYCRVPDRWISRYHLHGPSSQFLLWDGRKLVGSLGLLYHFGFVDGRRYKLAFFVDNCLQPEYRGNHAEAFGLLFRKAVSEARRRGAAAIFGWDFLKNADQEGELVSELGFIVRRGVNWFPGGTESARPPSPSFKLPRVWSAASSLIKLKHRWAELFGPRPPADVRIEPFQPKHAKALAELLNRELAGQSFAPRYSADALSNELKRLRAQAWVCVRGQLVVGGIACFLSAWSGWMYGKPIYQEPHEVVYVRTPLWFAVESELSDTLGPALVFRAMDGGGRYVFFVDACDRGVTWRRSALTGAGCQEPSYDFGALLVKPLDGGEWESTIERPCYMPSHLAVSPVV